MEDGTDGIAYFQLQLQFQPRDGQVWYRLQLPPMPY